MKQQANEFFLPILFLFFFLLFQEKQNFWFTRKASTEKNSAKKTKEDGD
jgi:hypothetical protein